MTRPAAGEITIQATASAISHGTEMLVYRGEVPVDLALDLPTLRGGFGFPIKYGYASVGRVVEVGEDVAAPQLDDLVFVHHPHQERYTVPAFLAIPLPPGVSAHAATLLANLETAVNVVLDAHPRLGDQVLVLGQGVVGLLVTLLLGRAGAEVVATVEERPRRRELSREFGAGAVLDPGRDLGEEVRRLTGGRGADLVVEASGSGRALDAALDCPAFQGTLVVCSWYGAKPVELHLGAAFHRRRLRLVSSQVSSVDPALTPRWSAGRRLALATRLLAELPLERLITHRLPFREAAEAYRLVAERPEETVQVLLTYP